MGFSDREFRAIQGPRPRSGGPRAPRRTWDGTLADEYARQDSNLRPTV